MKNDHHVHKIQHCKISFSQMYDDTIIICKLHTSTTKQFIQKPIIPKKNLYRYVWVCRRRKDAKCWVDLQVLHVFQKRYQSTYRHRRKDIFFFVQAAKEQKKRYDRTDKRAKYLLFLFFLSCHFTFTSSHHHLSYFVMIISIFFLMHD